MIHGFAALLATPMLQALPPGAPPEMLARLSLACDRLATGEQTSPEAIHSLASCLQWGVGRPVDLAQARALYVRASEMGFAQSQCALGNMMIKGEGGPTEVERELALCRVAAETGDANAQTDYGQYFLAGVHVPRDPAEARRWLAAAAEQGQPNAAYNLGKIYWNADGVERSRSEAARWWRIAYEHGKREAALLIANEALVRLQDGVDRPEDANPAVLDEAILWYGRAARESPDPAERQQAGRMLQMTQGLRAELARARD